MRRDVQYPRPVRSPTSPPDGASARLRTLALVVRVLGAALALGHLAAQVCLHVVVAASEAGITVLSRCVTGSGPGAWWATHLAMVRVDAACPEGTLALGGAPDDVAVVLASVTLPVLLVQLLVLAVAGRLLAVVRTTLRAVRAVLRPRPVRAAVTVDVPRARVRLVPRAVVHRPRVRVGGPVPVRRGPPLVAA